MPTHTHTHTQTHTDRDTYTDMKTLLYPCLRVTSGCCLGVGKWVCPDETACPGTTTYRLHTVAIGFYATRTSRGWYSTKALRVDPTVKVPT